MMAMSRCLERLDHGEQTLRLGLGQGRIRLVHDDELGVRGEGAGDLHHLALRDRKVPHGGVGVYVQVDELHRLPRAPLQLAPVDDPGAALHAAHEHVLDDRQRRHHRELLVDDGDPGVLRGGGSRVLHGLALEDDLARRARDDAAQHLDQRGLAGAVLADQRVHLASAQVELHVVQGLHAAVTLRQTVDSEDFFAVACGLVVLRQVSEE